MTEKEKKIMVELFNQGVPKTRIAKQLNCAPITILRNLRQLNVEQPSDPMIGQTFYYLTVLKRAEKREDLASRSIRYICKCKCGYEFDKPKAIGEMYDVGITRKEDM